MPGKFQFINIDELDRNNQPIKNNGTSEWDKLLLPSNTFSTETTYENLDRYDFDVHPGENAYEIAAQRQSGWQQAGYGLTKAAVTALGSATENIGLVVAAPTQMIYNAYDGNKSVASGLYDNWLGQFVDNINKSLQEKLPNYYTRAQNEMSFGRELGTVNFWADKFANGAGYWIGAAITPWGIEQGLGKLGIKSAVKSLISAGKGLSTAEFSNVLKVAGVGTVMSVGESNVEARQTKQETLDRLIALRDRGDINFHNKSDKELEDIADAAGNAAYIANLAVTMPTNILQFGKFIPGYKSLVSGSSNLVKEGLGKYTAKKTNAALSRAMSFGSGFLEEGGQELAQLGIQKGVQDYYTRNFDPESKANFVDAMKSSINAAYENLGTKEGLESIFLGGILGGPGQLVQNWNKSSKEYKQAQLLSNILTSDAYSKMTTNLDNLIRAKKSGELANQALKDGDKENFFTEQYNALKAYTKVVSDNGGLDYLISDLKELKNSSAEEVAKVLQIPVTEEWNEFSKNEKLDYLIKNVKDIADINSQLSAKFSQYAESPDKNKQAVFNAIFDGVTGLKNISEREKLLSKEADELLLNVPVEFISTENVLGKGQIFGETSSYKDKIGVLERQSKAVDNFNPSIAEQLAEKAKAFKYLETERKRLIDQFETATKTPEKIESKANALNTDTDKPSPEVTTVNPENFNTDEVQNFIKKADIETEFAEEDTPETHFSKLEDAVKHYTNKLRELDGLINKYSPEGLTTPVGDEFKKLKESGVYQSKLNKVQAELDSIKEAAKSKSKISPIVVFNGKRLNQMIQLTDLTNIELYNSLTTKELIDGVELKFVPYDAEGTETFATDPFNKTISNPNVKIVRGLIGTKKGIQIIYKGEIIGYLNDPTRFRFKNSKGQFVPFNKSTEHLEMLNPNFVTIENGNKIATEYGLDYLNTYEATVRVFEDLKSKVNTTDILTNEQVKSLFFVNSSIELDNPKTEMNVIDYLKKNSWMSTTKKDGSKQGALVYDRASNEYYIFNGETFDKIDSNENEYYRSKYITPNSELLDKITNNFIGVISEYQDYAGNTRIAVNALNYGKITDETPVSTSIVGAFTAINDKFKELIDAGTLEANKIAGEDSNNWNIFISSNSKVTINIKISGKKEGSKVKYPGLSLKIEERGKPSKIVALSNKESNSAIYVSKGKEGNYISFRNRSTTKTISTNEELVEALNIILKDAGENIEILNFLKRAKVSSTTLQDATIAKEAKRTVYFTPQKKYFGETKIDKSNFTPVPSVFSLVTEAQPVSAEGEFKEVTKGTFSLISDAQPVEQPIIEQNKPKTNEQEKTQEKVLQITSPKDELIALNNEREELKKRAFSLTKEEKSRFYALGREIQRLEDVLKASNKSNNNAFKIAESEAEDVINLRVAINNLKKILPANMISDKSLEDININLRNNGITWGGFINAMVYLSTKAGKGTEYHEAFHAIFRSFLNDIEQLSIYKEAKEKYGKPSSKDLNTLKSKSVDYEVYTNKQLEMLWYEEKLADDFQSYSKKGFKGFILRLFNKIKLFLNAIKGKESTIDSLFDNIYTGRFKSAEVQNNNFAVGKSAFKVLEKRGYTTPNGEFVSGYLSPQQNNAALTRVAYNSIKKLKETGELEDSDIIEIAHNLALEYYNPLLFDDILMDLATNDLNKFTTIERHINDVSDALTNTNNEEIIIKAVREKLNNYVDIKDFEEDSEQVEDNMPTEFGIKDNFLIGGLASASKKMREYLSFIEAGIDEFGFNLTDSQLLEDRFKGFLNPFELYNNIESTLVNTQRDKMLKKLFYLSQYNTNLASFLKYLSKDIFKELNLDVTTPIDELLNIPIETLAKSNTFNLFISNFQKIRQTQVDVLYNSDKQSVKIIRTNAQDVQDTQVAQWYRNYLSKELPEKKALDISNTLRDKIVYNEAIYVGNINKYISDIRDGLSKLGIEVSPLFIKFSIIDNAIKSGAFKNYKDSITDEATLKEIADYEDFYALYTGVNSIDSEFFKGLSYGIKSGNPFKEDETSEGAIGRLKQIALSNSFFDENVGNSTYQTVTGERVYSNLAPSYFSYEALLWQEDKRRSWIFEEKDKQALLAALESQGKVIDKYQFNKYYQAVKYNPLLKGLVGVKDNDGDFTGNFEYSKDFADLIFKQFKAFIHGGLREESALTGTNHASLTKRAKYITMLSYFSEKEGNTFLENRVLPNGLIEQGGKLIKNPKLTYRFSLFKPIQNEGKNTQYAYMMPVQEYFKGRELTKIGEEVFKNFFLQEYERIGEVQKEINEGTKIKVDNYNEGKLRGLDFWLFKGLKDIDSSLYSKLINNAKEGKLLTDEELEDILLAVNKMLMKEYELFYNDLIFEKIINSNNTSEIIPNYYLKDNKVDEEKIKSFFFNDYINTLSFVNLMFGDAAINFKNPVDFVKRMAGANASGASVGVNQTRIAVIGDESVADEFTEDKHKEDINASDAQSYSHAFYFSRKYLQGLGKKSPIVGKIIKKMIRGEKLTQEEVKILNNETALANPKKLSIFDLFFYGKTSVKFILRSQVSYRDKGDKQRLNDLYTELEKYQDGSKEYRHIMKKIHQLWKPMPGQEFLHDLLNRMELPVNGETIDIVLRESAVKTQIVNKTNPDEPLRPTIVSDNYIREQVVTDGIKNKIIHGTQLIQLITAEQKLDTIIEFLGRESTIGKAVEAYKKHLSKRIEMKYNLVREILFQNGVKSYEELLKIIGENLDASNSDSITKELFSISKTTDEPQYSLNNPRVEQKFENMFLAFVKSIFSHKVPGFKLSLVSDSGNNVLVDSNDKVIGKSTFEKDPSKYVDATGKLKKGFEVRRLKEIPEGNIFYAECKISASIASHFKIKEGDIVNPELLNLVATRIPTDDKHSMVYLKVVEVLPGETGNELVVSPKFIKLAGFDFDIDAEYTRYKGFSKDKLTGELNLYGDYLKADNINTAIEKAFKEFIADALEQNHKVNSDLTKLKSINTDYINSQKAVQELKKELKEITSDFDEYINEAIKSILDSTVDVEEAVTVLKEFFPKEFKELNEGGFIYSKNSKESKDIVNEIVAGNYVIKRKKKRLKELVEEKKNVKLEIFYDLLLAKENLVKQENKLISEVFEVHKLPKDIKEFSDKYAKTIENNLVNLSKGNIDLIEPITISEINNLLFDIEKNLIRNVGNKKIADTPISRELPDGFVNFFYKEKEKPIGTELSLGGEQAIQDVFDDPTGVSSIGSIYSKVTLDDANTVGKANIGIAALNNTSFQYLADANVSSRIDDDIFPKDKLVNNYRVNDIIGTNVNMATDNAKHQDAAYMGLNTETLGATLYSLNTKRTFDYAMLINLQPSVKYISRGLLNISGDIKIEEEQFIKKDDFISKKFSELLKLYKEFVGKAGKESKITSLNTVLLQKAVLFNEKKQVDDFDILDYTKVQLLAVEEFIDNKKKADFLRHFTVLTSLIKGTESDWSKVQKVDVALKTLGLEIVELGNTGKLSDFEVRHSVDYLTNEKSEEKYIFNVLPAITGNEFLHTELKAFAAMVRDSKEFFIIQTNTAKEIKSILEEEFKEGYFDYPNNYKKFKNDLLSYLMIKSFKHKTGTLTSFTDVLSEKGIPTKLISLYYDLLKDNYWRNNLFIKNVEPSVSKEKAFGDLHIYSLNTNTRISLNPEFKRTIAESFTELFNGNGKLSEESNQLANKFAIEALKYLISKDSANFKNQSFIQFIEPHLFKRMNLAMKSVEDTFAKDSNYNDTFGISKEELIKEFTELFIRNIDNFYGLPKEKRGIEPSVGHKELSPYAFTVNEWNKLIELTEAIQELSQSKSEEESSKTIYSQLGNKTVSENVVIKPWGELKDVIKAIITEGIVSTRIKNSNEHFGNPFSHDTVGKTQGLIKTETIKEAVEKYIDWVINSQDARAKWIRKQLQSGELKGKPILYYKELGEPSHATALDYLINKYDWNKPTASAITTEANPSENPNQLSLFDEEKVSSCTKPI